MGCREHETDHSVFDVHQRERGGGGRWTADCDSGLVFDLVLLFPGSALLEAICGGNDTKRRREDGVKMIKQQQQK